MSNYLNPKFKFNLSLVAENFYLNEEFNKVKKIITNFDKKDEFYYWFRLKKEAQIIVEEQGYENAIKFIKVKFDQIQNPNLKMIFDVANFYKNSKKYEKAIEYYSQIIITLDDQSELRADLFYRRGGATRGWEIIKKQTKIYLIL